MWCHITRVSTHQKHSRATEADGHNRLTLVNLNVILMTTQRVTWSVVVDQRCIRLVLRVEHCSMGVPERSIGSGSKVAGKVDQVSRQWEMWLLGQVDTRGPIIGRPHTCPPQLAQELGAVCVGLGSAPEVAQEAVEGGVVGGAGGVGELTDTSFGKIQLRWSVERAWKYHKAWVGV